MNVYPFIAAERAAAHHVTTACALLEVSTSAYYQWSRHVPSARERRDAVLGERIERIHHDSRGTYGRHACTPGCTATASASARGASPG